MDPLPLKNPKISSESVVTGTSFATGSPCFVIKTVSCFALTSSIMERHFVLNVPAGTVFIVFLFTDYGHYTMVKYLFNAGWITKSARLMRLGQGCASPEERSEQFGPL